MASGQIRMTPDTMRARAMEYRNEGTNLGNIITSMDNLLTALLEEWEGTSSEAYANKFAELRPGFVEAENLINEIANALDKSANALEETDNNIASAFNS